MKIDLNTKVGDEFNTVVAENITRTQIVQYAGASGDYNPIHTDEVFSTKVAGYPSVFAHGMLTMGMTGKLITNLADIQRLKNYGVRFTSQVWPGDTLTASAQVHDISEKDGERLVSLILRTTNQDGVEVLNGRAVVAV